MLQSMSKGTDIEFFSNSSEAEERLKEITQAKIRLLRAQKKYTEQNKLEFFRPNPPQQKIFDAYLIPKYKTLAATGGNRLGKTALGVILALSTMFGKYLWNGKELQFPHSGPRVVRYVCNDLQRHGKRVVVPAIEKWWPKNRPKLVRNDHTGVKAYWTDKETGSELEIFSSKQPPTSHAGSELDLVIFDEPMSKEIYHECVARLTNRSGKDLLCMTLLEEHVWIDQTILKATNEDGTPKMNIFTVNGSAYDNVGYGLDGESGINDLINRIKLTTDNDTVLNARIYGLPAYLSGLVFPMFKRSIHVIPAFDIPRDWLVDIAFDVHPATEQAVLFTAKNRKGEIYVIDEIWQHMVPEDLAIKVASTVLRNNWRVGNVVIEPGAQSDKNNKNTVYDRICDVLYSYGIPLTPGSKDRKQATLNIRGRLMTKNQCPALWLFSNCKQAIWEHENWTINKTTGKPRDENDHMIENLGRILLADDGWYPEPHKRCGIDRKITWRTA